MTDKTINDIYYCKLSGLDFVFYDSILSGTVNTVSGEIDNYDFDSIDFKEGDVVIDIGGNKISGWFQFILLKNILFLKYTRSNPLFRIIRIFFKI